MKNIKAEMSKVAFKFQLKCFVHLPSFRIESDLLIEVVSFTSILKKKFGGPPAGVAQ